MAFSARRRKRRAHQRRLVGALRGSAEEDVVLHQHGHGSQHEGDEEVEVDAVPGAVELPAQIVTQARERTADGKNDNNNANQGGTDVVFEISNGASAGLFLPPCSSSSPRPVFSPGASRLTGLLLSAVQSYLLISSPLAELFNPHVHDFYVLFIISTSPCNFC